MVVIRRTDSYASNMDMEEKLLYADTRFQVIDMVYAGRPARILFIGDHVAAQSGLAQDSKPELLFDYNQRLLEVVTYVQPGRILLIGGGAYTWPVAVLQKFSHIHIDVVEPEVSLETIATRFFGLKPDERLRIIHQDGATFLATTTCAYDLIVIDAFDGLVIPPSLTAMRAVQNMRKRLNDNGTVAMNIVGPYLGRGGEALRGCYERFQATFGTTALYPADSKYSLWESQNFVLVARRGSAALPELRFTAVLQDAASKPRR